MSLYDTGPAFPLMFEARFLTLVSYAFIVPTIWGLSARWLPVFLGLNQLHERKLRYALFLSILGTLLMAVGLLQVAHWTKVAAMVIAVAAFRFFEQATPGGENRGSAQLISCVRQDRLHLDGNRLRTGRLRCVF